MKNRVSVKARATVNWLKAAHRPSGTEKRPEKPWPGAHGHGNRRLHHQQGHDLVSRGHPAADLGSRNLVTGTIQA